MISANKHQGDDGCWDQQMLPEEFNDDETPTEEFDEEMNVIKVENLEFIPGILGQGNFGTVRLAKRKLSGGNSSSSSSCYSVQTSPRRRKNASKPAPSSIFNKFAVGESTENDGGKHNSFRRDFRHAFSTPPTHEYKNRRQNNYINLNMFSRSRDDIDSDDEETDNDQLVAVKIFSKSNLKRRRTIERDKNTKSVKIRNAYQQVEREIALMKKLSHPNLVQLYEVIDSPETDILYMVLEYMPLGEILTYQEHNATFKRSESLRHKKIDGLINGHFDEEQAALYFVDILHGLAYLHQHHICHRDLKPENILLSNKKIAKIGDFGVSHIFEEESENGPRRYLTSIEEDHQLHRHHLKTTAQSEKTIRRNTDFKMNETSSFSSSPPPSSSSSFTSLEESEHNPFVFSQEDFSNAYDMGAMAGSGILSKTEGTWCFWSPEMCNGSQGFSLYAADIWAAGICLYIFVTGKLPFYSTVPLDLFEMIAKAEVQYSDLGLSDELIDLLKCCLEKDPNCRAGVGDCLHHPFLKNAREQRIQELGAEFQTSRPVIDISEDDIRMAFRTVTSVPVQVLRTAGKKISEGLAHTRDNLRSRMHSMPSMGSSTNSKDEHPNRNCKNSGIDSKKDDNIVNIDSSSKKKCDHNVVYFNRQESGDSVHSNPFSVESDIHENDNGSVTDTPFSRLSSGISFGSNMTEEIPPTMEEDYDRGDDQGHYDDNQHNPDVFEADESRLPVHSASDTTIGRRNEHHLVGKQPERLQRTSTASISDGDSMKHENKKGAEHPGCLIH